MLRFIRNTPVGKFLSHLSPRVKQGAVVLGVVMIGIWALAGKPKSEKPVVVAPPRVTVVKTQLRELVDTILTTGTLVPAEEIRIMAQVEGLAITDVLVDEGAKVEKGQVLAKLDSVTLKTQLAQVAANLTRAEASTIEAQRALARVQQLRQTGFSSVQQLDQQLARTRVAEADKLAMQAQKTELETRLARSDIRAPIGGVIARRNARIGAIASAAQPLFTLIADGAVELEAEVADVQHARLRVGQKAEVNIPARDAKIAGTVRVVSPQIDPASRLGMVRIVLNAAEPLAVGGYARAKIETARKQAVSVPLSAITTNAKGHFVQLSLDGAVKTQVVTLGILADGYAEIVEGLKENDEVVARAGSFLRDGDKITPITTGE